MRTVKEVKSGIEEYFFESVMREMEFPDPERARKLLATLSYMLEEFEYVKTEYIKDEILSLLKEVK